MIVYVKAPVTIGTVVFRDVREGIRYIKRQPEGRVISARGCAGRLVVNVRNYRRPALTD